MKAILIMTGFVSVALSRPIRAMVAPPIALMISLIFVAVSSSQAHAETPSLTPHTPQTLQLTAGEFEELLESSDSKNVKACASYSNQHQELLREIDDLKQVESKLKHKQSKAVLLQNIRRGAMIGTVAFTVLAFLGNRSQSQYGGDTVGLLVFSALDTISGLTWIITGPLEAASRADIMKVELDILRIRPRLERSVQQLDLLCQTSTKTHGESIIRGSP